MEKNNVNDQDGSWASVLLDETSPIGTRVGAALELRTRGGPQSVVALCACLIAGAPSESEKKSPELIKEHPSSLSSLLRHEVAFNLGQMQDPGAIPTLEAVLRDKTDCPVVRHECAEALGAIGDPIALPVLKEFCEDERPEVSETCKIAVDRMEWMKSHPEGNSISDMQQSAFETIDPAPAFGSSMTVSELVAALMDTELPLFRRYQAMFSLRNNGSDEAVLGLTKGLSDGSALFRHEVAYVLGQLENLVSVPALIESLNNKSEHGMVRHEAAEALGAIGSEECVKLLEQFRYDDDSLVAESCDAALESLAYWRFFENSIGTSAANEVENENKLSCEA